MVICYQYESAYFPAPYADNQLLCSLCGPKRHGVTPLILRAPNTKISFSSKSSNFSNFTPRIHQKWSQKVRNPKFSWGHAPRPYSRNATHAFIAYWNPPFQNSRSATVLNGLHCFVQGNWWISKEKIASAGMDECVDNFYTSKELNTFVTPSSLSTQSVVNGRHLSYGRSQHTSWSVTVQILQKFQNSQKSGGTELEQTVCTRLFFLYHTWEPGNKATTARTLNQFFWPSERVFEANWVDFSVY